MKVSSFFAIAMATSFTYSVAVGSQDLNRPRAYPHEYQYPPPPTSGEMWIPGLDYYLIVPPTGPGFVAAEREGRSVEFRTASPKKTWVKYYFRYTDDMHYKFDRALEEWFKTRSDHVELIRVPTVNWEHVRYYARLFYTLKEMERQDLHFAVYEWMRKPEYKQTVYHKMFSPGERTESAIRKANIAFAKAHDLDEKIFTKIYDSKKIDNWIAAEGATVADTNGHASLLVNGRFATSRSQVNRDTNIATIYSGATITAENARMLKLLDYLVESERARLASGAKPKE